MEKKTISITEKEYKDFIRLQVSNEELERITQKRIDDALADSNKKHSEDIERLKNDFKAEKDKIFDDILHENAINVVIKHDSSSYYTETIHFIDNNGDAIKYVAKIHDAFDKAGYYCQHFLLDGSKMGVPQRRERVFFVCLRKDIATPFLYQVDMFEQKPRLTR